MKPSLRQCSTTSTAAEAARVKLCDKDSSGGDNRRLLWEHFVDRPIQQLFDWVDGNGPAPNIEPNIASIEVIETVAVVRLEVKHWSGHLRVLMHACLMSLLSLRQMTDGKSRRRRSTGTLRS